MKINRILSIAAIGIAAFLHAQAQLPLASGMAWKVRGAWHIEGNSHPIAVGDAISPGALLQPTAENSAHSITVLLPDGQSILSECFTAKDCARGFRVPVLFRSPDPFAEPMLERIRAVLLKQHASAKVLAKPSQIARAEEVIVLGPDKRIELGGLAAKLSNGNYFGDLKSYLPDIPERTGIPLRKSARSIALTVPGPGLYQLTITDSLKWPRIDFLIAVVSGGHSSVAGNFRKEHALLGKWANEYFGWPMHDFQRAYLESLMLGIPPAPASAKAPRSHPRRRGVTAEPRFSPPPGISPGDSAISIHSATPGATIHYTLGGSQPLEDAAIYRAPIVMKGLPMTIKAFASAPGKKDSPVVTANFRLGRQEN